jgi:hypothetical protein
MDEAGIPALQEAIENMHGCKSKWIESVAVLEVFNNQTVWSGEVEVFEIDHPKAKRCYAWSHETENGKRMFYAVLGMPPVDSAVAAVRIAIAAG